VQPNAWQALRATLQASLVTVGERAGLLSVLAITVIYGMSSEACSRLAPLHILANVGLPGSFTAATWFGILHAGAFLGGAVVTWLIGQTIAPHALSRIVQMLLALTAVMLLATLLFALAGVFWLALLAAWMTRWGRIAVRPLMVVWMNHGLAPGGRATVLSMLGQAEALGEICGGPLFGLVSTLHTVRSALVGAAAVLLPALPLYGQVLRQSKREAHEA
jgi:DHA3 family tetracycline resistance protein-like MFS transporter